MSKKIFVSLTCFMAIFLLTHIADAQEPIRGPWLWMIAPTEANQGGQASTDIDSLAVASSDAVTEDMVAANGANEGDAVGDYQWTLGELPENGDINVAIVDIGMTDVVDFNDVSSYGLIILESDSDQTGVTMGVSSDDSVKVWLNGEVVHTNAVNRGRGATPANIDAYQDKVEVNLIAGDNVLLVKVSERGGGWGQYVGIDADVNAVYKPFPPPVTGKITGPWLWMIAPTEANQGGANSTDVDSLSDASGGAVTEDMIAMNGANAGDIVGSLEWTVGEIADSGGNNVNDLITEIGLGEGDVNDHSVYGLIILDAPEDQSGVPMKVGSDDSIKVWLNGEVVHTNAVNRGASDFQDDFKVNLVAGPNVLLVKVSERGGGWSMFAGVGGTWEVRQDIFVSVEPAGKFFTTWGSLKAQ